MSVGRRFKWRAVSVSYGKTYIPSGGEFCSKTTARDNKQTSTDTPSYLLGYTPVLYHAATLQKYY
jgi:hypothetical protein